jgi:two-component system CheB/CheR fusion protein
LLLREAFERTLQTGIGYHVELRVLKEDGEITWIESQCDCTLSEGKVIRLSGTSLDITVRKRSEAELWLAKIGAEEANAAKTQFLANMSHEIRTPLGAIVGFLGLLKNQNLSRATFRNYVSVIERNSDQLLRLVNDILDLSKVEAGRMLVDQSEIRFPR